MSQRIEVDTKTFVRFWLVILGFGLLALFIWKAMAGLLIVAIAIFLAVALRPLAKKIDNIDKHKDRSSISSVLAVVIVVVGIALVIALVGPVVVSETARFVGQAPELFADHLGGNTIQEFGEAIGIENLGEQVVSAVRDFSNSFINNFSNLAMTSVGAIANFLTSSILVIVLTILFMLQGPALMENLWSILAGKDKTAKPAKVMRRVVERMADVVAKYVSGQLLVAIIDGVVVATAVLVLSLIFNFSMGLAVPMGLIAMILYLIPMFGPIITCVLVSLLVFFNSTWAALAFAIFYIIYAQIANNVISPKIQGKEMNLPPLVILVAITIGMYTFGLIGTIIAIPIAGCVKVLIEEYPNIKAMND